MTFILVIIVILMCPDKTTAIIAIGSLLGFYIAYRSAGGFDDRGSHEADRLAESGFDNVLGSGGNSCGSKAEEFYPLPGNHPPYAVGTVGQHPGVGDRPAPQWQHYPGAIDIDEYDSESANGVRDRLEDDNNLAAEGNPFDLDRVASPRAADACVDDEANDDEIDGDERIVYNSMARNEPTRVIAGTMNRLRDMDKYFREEVEEREDDPWWGRHEV